MREERVRVLQGVAMFVVVSVAELLQSLDTFLKEQK